MSGLFENKSASVVQLDFLGLPSRTLLDVIELLRLDSYVHRLIEPIQVGFVVGDPP